MKYYTGIGSRNIPQDQYDMLKEYGKILHEKGYTLRSGGADGSDSAFEEVAGDLKEIYLPWKGFNDNPSLYYNGNRAGLIDNETWFKAGQIAAEFYHSPWETTKHTVKKLMTRNVFQVLGLDLQTPSELVVCWTPDGTFQGGTAQALKVARHNKLDIYNLRNDMDRILLAQRLEL